MKATTVQPDSRLARLWERGVNILGVLRLCWRASPWMSLAIPGLSLAVGVTPALYLLIGKKVIDTLALGIKAGPTGPFVETLGWYLLLGLALKASAAVAQEASWAVQQIFQKRLVGCLQEEVLRKALSLDLACFESPAFYNRLQRAQQEVGYRPYMVLSSLIAIGQMALTMLSCSAILILYSLWAVLAMLAVMLTSLWLQSRYGQIRWAMMFERTGDERKMYYLQSLMTNNREAKEIRIFGLQGYLLDNWRLLFRRFYAQERGVTVRYAGAMTAASVAQVIAGMAFYGWVLYSALCGAISLGAVVMFTQAMEQCLGTTVGIVQSLGVLYESSLFLSNLFEFLQQQPLLREPEEAVPLSQTVRGRLQLENVTFRYPETNQVVLHNLTLTIEPGSRVALVGENGAGKTTIVKLLARLYDPDSGAVSVDGVDLRTVATQEWHRHLTVIFQDFVQYWLTARENVTFGSLDDRGDARRLDRVAQDAGALPMISGLPEGWDTVLGRRFDRGCELSLGEWQRVALARALFSPADILILDEPTASLDAKQEHELFQRFERLTRGKTTLLISHRLSATRLVDHIFFLENGRVAEAGSHEELMKRDGLYAAMFRRQASGYTEPLGSPRSASETHGPLGPPRRPIEPVIEGS